ncbi:MAG: PDGLE domain-containing protein [Promethearchaeota archaeon]
MDRNTVVRVIIPALIVLFALISVLILTGFASENPDGFEWSLFEWAGITEPESGFGGIFAFLGEGPLVDVVTGGIGIVLILIIAYLFFRFTSRRTE